MTVSPAAADAGTVVSFFLDVSNLSSELKSAGLKVHYPANKLEFINDVGDGSQDVKTALTSGFFLAQADNMGEGELDVAVIHSVTFGEAGIAAGSTGNLVEIRFTILDDSPARVVFDTFMYGLSGSQPCSGWVNQDVVIPDAVSFSGEVTINGAPAQPGDEIRISDPDGVRCGTFVVDTEGVYGPVDVTGDNPATAEDEGAEPGDVLDFAVYDAGDDKEYSGYEIFFDVLSGEYPPEWTSSSDNWQVNIEARDVADELAISNIIISLDNSRTARDQIKIQKAALPAALLASGFDPDSDDVVVVVDWEIFEIPAGSFTSRGTRRIYRHKSPGGAQGQIQMMMDFERRGTWSFRIAQATLGGIDNSDGVDICLAVSSAVYGKNYAMDEKCHWKFNARRNSADAMDVSGTAMALFAIERAGGKYDNTRQRNDHFNVQRAEFALPAGETFDPAVDEVSLAIDDMSLDFVS